MIYFNWPPGPFLATQYNKEPGGAGFEASEASARAPDHERHKSKHIYVDRHNTAESNFDRVARSAMRHKNNL